MKEGALDIQKLLPVDEEGEYIGDGDINIQFYTWTGGFDHSFAYYGEGEFEEDTDPAGWYDENDGVLAKYEFASGESFQIYGTANAFFNYSGEVKMAETDVPVRRGLSFQGNVRPCTVDIQTIIPVDEDGEYIGDGDFNIQFYTYTGGFSGSFAYYGEGEFEEDTDPAGWYNEDDGILAEYTFAAGEGFKAYTTVAGFLRFPEL